MDSTGLVQHELDEFRPAWIRRVQSMGIRSVRTVSSRCHGLSAQKIARDASPAGSKVRDGFPFHPDSTSPRCKRAGGETHLRSG